MLNRVASVFRLRADEIGIVAVMSFLLLSNSLARQVTNILAVSGLVSGGSVNQMLLVLLVDYVVVLLVGGLQSLIVDRVNRIRLMRYMSLGFALLFLLVRGLFIVGIPPAINYTLLYLIAEQQWILFPLVFWVLANDVFDLSQAKRLLPFIGSWSFIGRVVGSGVAAVSPTVVDRLGAQPEDVLLLNVLIYLFCLALAWWKLGRVKVRETVQKHETVRETLTEGWGFVREVPSFRYLMLAIMMLALCDTIIEFRFLVVSDLAFTNQAAYQRFYSLYSLGVTVVCFVLQSSVTSRLVDRFGMKNTLFIFPAVVLAGVVGMLATPYVGIAIAAMGALQVVRATIDDSSRKLFQALVPEERRGRVGTFMDNYLPAVGTIMACLSAGAIVWIGSWLNLAWYHYLYLSLVVAGGLTAFWATWRMRQVYETSLFNWRLKRRQRGASVLDRLDF